jgi:hypothetical protein
MQSELQEQSDLQTVELNEIQPEPLQTHLKPELQEQSNLQTEPQEKSDLHALVVWKADLVERVHPRKFPKLLVDDEFETNLAAFGIFVETKPHLFKYCSKILLTSLSFLDVQNPMLRASFL